MNVKRLPAQRPEPIHAQARMPVHPEYPIVQAFSSDHPDIQQQLMHLPWQEIVEREQALLLADYNGLRALGRCESALDHVAGELRRRFGAALVAAAPGVRYGEGNPTLEPYMVVLVHAPGAHLARVRGDLLARRGRITRVVDRSMFVLEGEAPLAELLGYRKHIRGVLAGDWDQSHFTTWLSRYVPMQRDGPEAA